MMPTLAAAGAEEEARELPSREEAHLYLALQRFSFCLERHAARRAEEPPADGEDLAARIGLEIEALDDYIAEHYADEGLPIARLCRQLGLDDVAQRLLIAAAAPALDLSLAHRLEAITGRVQPDAGLLVAATTADLFEERSALAALRATAPLVRCGLIRLGTSPDWTPETPLLFRPVVVPERIIDWLRGGVAFEPELFERAARLRSAPTPESIPPLTSGDPVTRALFRFDGERHLPLVVAGPAAAGKAAAVRAAASARGLSVLDVDLEEVARSPRAVDLLRELVREAMLQEAVLLLRRADGLRGAWPGLRRAVGGVLADGLLCTALTTRGEWRDDVHGIPGAQLVELEAPAGTPP
jgi:hypothetical protein